MRQELEKLCERYMRSQSSEDLFLAAGGFALVGAAKMNRIADLMQIIRDWARKELSGMNN
jgi:hypothetical protein